MSLPQQLVQELTSLASESKRRNPEIRHATDKSIELLRTSPDSSNLSNLLKAHPDFVDPFLLSCQSRNSKLTSISVQCLGKLLMINALPVSKLDLIIDSLLECTHSTPEIQLKVLQMLPTFYQSNSSYLKDEILSRFLNICSSLQGSNKPTSVMNTASATFLQLINLIFEQVTDEDKGNVKKTHEVEIDDGKKIDIGDRAYDIQRIMYDLCTLIEHHKPAFLKTNYLTEDFGFELLESVIKNNKTLFLKHVELGYLLRTRVAPITLRFLSSSKDFTIMVRVSKLILLLIKDQFDVLKIETEVSLSLLTHTITKESASPYWKKILSLEIYNALFKDIEFTQNIVQEYDNNKEEERKPVFADFLTAAYSVVVEQKNLLNTSTAIQVPTSHEANQDSVSLRSANINSAADSSVFSYLSSSIKIPYIDMLDKPDPPAIPETYASFLVIDSIIRLTESICAFGLDLSYIFSEREGESGISFLNENSFDGEHEEYNFKFVRALITISWERTLQIFELFIYSVVDHDMFIKVLRALQKLCHVSGVLGLDKPRNEILSFFAKCTLRLNGKSSLRQKTFSISESIVGTINSAFSTISTANTDAAAESLHALPMYSRDLNSRNVMCFRVLMSLATSLSDILDENWRTILITVQWMSYYIDGPSGSSFRDIPPVSIHLKNQDLGSVETSLKRFFESMKTQTSDIFAKVIKSAIQLSSSVTQIPVNDLITGRVPVDDKNNLQACSFNTLFYIDYITELCELNPTDFLLENPDNSAAVNSFYIKLATNRELDDDIRLYASRDFNVVCKAMGVSGFEKCASLKETPDAYEHLSVITENRTFSSLNNLMTDLSKLPMSGDGILSNAEVEMYLQSLNCLQSLINRFGTLIKKHWELVFNMVSLPLEIIYGSDDLNKEKILAEIIVSVLRSSFETMKVVLDEMLQSIPIDQIKVIIDCLFKFISQRYDLNISLNSISYFWLISDYTKEKISSKDNSKMNILENSISSDVGLINGVTDLSYGIEDRYRCLWTYLVFQLAKISQDHRTQVRNGSLMTFFSVVESHIDLGESWKLIYGIIIEPVIMEIRPNIALDELSTVDRKDWSDSLSHIINGLTKLFTVFLNGEQISDSDAVYWKGLIDYYEKMNSLSLNYVELNLHVHKSYGTLINNFFSSDDVAGRVPRIIIEDLYKFWTNVPISYNLSNDSLYQECVCAHMNAFHGLYKLIQPSMTTEKFEKILMIFNSCVRYPVIPAGQRDDTKCTDLQQSVIKNLGLLDVEAQNPKFISLLIQQVALIVTLPFSTKEMIEKKLSNRCIRIPSFISISYEALELLDSILNKIDDFTPYINDRCLLKTYKSLLECSKVKMPQNVGGDRIQLWMYSMNILASLTEKVVKLLKDNDQIDSKISVESKAALWPLIIDSFKTTILYTQPSQEFEEYDLEKYNQLKSTIVNNLNLKSVDNGLIDELVSTVWTNSFLYALDDIENEIVSASGSPLEMSKNLAGFKFESMDGSIEPIKQLPRSRISKSCLRDLISFAKPSLSSGDSTSSLGILSTRSVPYLTSRVAFVLRKLLVDIRLLNKQPLPIIQQAELLIVLQGLSSTISDLESGGKEESELVYSNLRILGPLFIKCLALGSKVDGISDLITDICISLNSATTKRDSY